MSTPRHERANAQAREATQVALAALAEALSDAIFRRLVQPRRPAPRGENGHTEPPPVTEGPADDGKR